MIFEQIKNVFERSFLLKISDEVANLEIFGVNRNITM